MASVIAAPSVGDQAPALCPVVNDHNTPDHKRTFGSWTVTVVGHSIRIGGEWLTNYGVFYDHNFTRYKEGETGLQVYGMYCTIGLTASVRHWLDGLVTSGKVT